MTAKLAASAVALLLLYTAYPDPVGIPPDPKPAPVVVSQPAAACPCGPSCSCSPCTEAEYNALLQERVHLKNRVAELEQAAAVPPKGVCNTEQCRVTQAAPVRAAPVAYYQKRPVYGRFGRLLYYENVLVRAGGNCATGGCR